MTTRAATKPLRRAASGATPWSGRAAARLGAWALAAVVLLPPGAARAQSDADRATARQLTTEAERKLAAREYEAAYWLLAKAYAIVPSPMIKVGMGRAKAAQNQLIEAQQHFVEASKTPPRPNEPASWAAGRETARREAEAVTPRLASFEFVVEGAPDAGALRVLIDNRDEVPKAALENAIPRAVNPGVHAVRAEAEGFKPFEARVSATEGEKKKVTLRLQPSGAAAAAIVPKPTPPSPSSSSAPEAAPAPAPAPGGEPKEAGGLRWTPMTIGGVAAAGVLGTVGLVTGAISWSRVSSIKSTCTPTCPESQRDDLDSARSLGNVSTYAFLGAGVGGAVALVGFLTADAAAKPDKQARGKVSVLVGPGLLGLQGRF